MKSIVITVTELMESRHPKLAIYQRLRDEGFSIYYRPCSGDIVPKLGVTISVTPRPESLDYSVVEQSAA